MNVSSSRKMILLIACLASFVTPFMGSSINLAIVSTSEDFGTTSLMSSWIANIFILAAAVFYYLLGVYQIL